MNAPRFLTLTLQPEAVPLAQVVANLQTWFRKLRRTDFWKSHVVGGVYALELTWSRADGHAHLHLHAIIDGSYIPHALLRRTWQMITGGSKIVDIRAVHDREQTAAYISRYIAKPTDLEAWTDENIQDFAAAMHGVRMLNTFGKSHNANIDAADQEPKLSAVAPLISIARLRKACELQDAQALEASRRLVELGGWWKRLLHSPEQCPLEVKELPDASPPTDLCQILREIDARYSPSEDSTPPPNPTHHAPRRAHEQQDLPRCEAQDGTRKR
jgi:hypothetical protein